MLTVLHAHGDSRLRESCSSFLAARGFHVRSTGSGIDCIVKLREQIPALLIVDVDLPWGGGDGVLAIMREDTGLSQVPVVITSAGSARWFRPVASTLPDSAHLTELFEAFAETSEMPSVGYSTNPSDEPSSGMGDIMHRLEHEILMRTGRRVLNLRVENTDRAIIVHGQARTYHAKQLVLVAAMNYLADSGIDVQFDIEVIGAAMPYSLR